MIYIKKFDFEPSCPITPDKRLILKQTRDAVVKYALEKETGKKYSELEFLKKEFGKPYLCNSEVHFNITHTQGLVCCAVSDSEIGIDAEFIRPVDLKIMNKVFTDSEQKVILTSADPHTEFFKFWTVKESIVKLLGTGFYTPFKNVCVKIKNDTIVSNFPEIAIEFVPLENYVIAVANNICCKNRQNSIIFL